MAGNSRVRSAIFVRSVAPALIFSEFQAAEQVGLRSLAVRLSFKRLRDDAPLPCIAHWEGEHFIVVYEITRHKVRVADPAAGLIDYSHEEFLRASSPPDSAPTESNAGIYLLVEITPVFQERNLPSEAEEESQRGLTFFFNYLRPHRRLLFQVLLGMAVGLLVELICPSLPSNR